MTRALMALITLLGAPQMAYAQEPMKKLAAGAESAFQTLFRGTLRLTLEPIAPTAGVTAGAGVAPKPWRTESLITIVRARASASTNKYWAVDGSVAWQHMNTWRVEPYVRLRSMKQLNFFGVGNESLRADRADFSMLDRRVGAYGYARPVGWLAIGARGEGSFPRTSSGHSDTLPSIEEKFSPVTLTGFSEKTNYIYIGGFANLNYPYVRSERPRRGGDYGITLGLFHDTSGTGNSFRRFEVEGQERFPVFGTDRALTFHGRLSSSRASSGNEVPFYLMDTLGGADNLRGFKEEIIGGDETTSTIRSYESFRFRDTTTAFIQAEFRQRLYAQLFISLFADAGTVATTVTKLSADNLRRGVGAGLGLFRANALMIRAEFSLWGGEGHPHYFTPGRGLQF